MGRAADDPVLGRCVGELGQGLGLAPSTASHHIKELRQAAIVRVERHGQDIHCWIDVDKIQYLADFFRRSLAACGGSTAAVA
jgi:ArsR family transcriptional regulator